VTYQGAGSNHIYILTITPKGSSSSGSITAAINNGGTYSISGITSPIGLAAVYDNTGNGLKILGTGSGGTTVQPGNGSSVNGSGDVACLVGYYGG
jgi:hypothetical protein